MTGPIPRMWSLTWARTSALAMFIGICSSGCHKPAAQTEEPAPRVPVASIAPTKDAYLEGEPIEVQLTILNQSQWQIEFSSDSISFPSARNDSELEFRTGSPGIELLKPATKKSFRGGIFSSVVLGTGESKKSAFYLQRYLKQPPPGSYCVSFTLKVPYYLRNVPGRVGGHDDLLFDPKLLELTTSNMFESGWLDFQIVSGHPKDLDDIWSGYANSLIAGSRSEAIEALSVVADPAIAPHLAKVFAHSDNLSLEQLVELWSRFREDDGARSVLVACVNDQNETVVHQALHVLAALEIEISIEQLSRLLTSENAFIRRVARDYVAKINREKFNNLVGSK